MPTLAIIGAGSQLGGAVARRFAKEGFSVALISRTASRVAPSARSLSRWGGRSARGTTATWRDRGGGGGQGGGPPRTPSLPHSPSPTPQQVPHPPPPGVVVSPGLPGGAGAFAAGRFLRAGWTKPNPPPHPSIHHPPPAGKQVMIISDTSCTSLPAVNGA